MPRNKLAGTKVGNSRTAKFYQENPKARKKKLAYDKAYGATEERKQYRTQLQRERRKRGIHASHNGKYPDHVSKTKMVLKPQSKNRADKSKVIFRNKKK